MEKIFKRVLALSMASVFVFMAVGAVTAVCVEASDREAVRAYQYIYSEPSEYGHSEQTLVDEYGNPVSSGDISADDLTVNATTLPLSYDLRTYNRVTPVKNQSPYGTCWAFAAISCAESDMITDGYVSENSADYSEDHLVWFSGKVSPLGDGRDNSNSIGSGKSAYEIGGSCYTAVKLLSSRTGTELESNAPYTAPYGNYSDSQRFVSYANLQNTYLLAESNDATRTNMPAVKQYIMDEGAVQISFYSANTERDGYSGFGSSGASEYSYYQNIKTGTNHDVVIIGWDDNYSRTNFDSSMRPAYNGAWLIKNSWGTSPSFGNGGYMWISYYDTSLQDIYAFDYEPADNYDNIYQYDTFGNGMTISSGKSSSTMANIFTANGKEILKAISFVLPQANVNYTVKIYKGVTAGAPESGTLQSASTTSDSVTYSGYKTIVLNSPVSLTAGEKYSVVVTLSTKDGSAVRLPYEGGGNQDTYYNLQYSSNQGESFYFFNNKWVDTAVTVFNFSYGDETINNACIKAFTDMEKTLSSIAVTTAPEKTSYFEGDTLDTTGLVITALFSDNSKEDVTADCTFSPVALGSAGEKTITVSYKYGGTTKTATFTVTVKVMPEITASPNNVSLAIGESRSITVTTVPASQSVDFSAASSDCISISKSGSNTIAVKGVSVGSATFYATMSYQGTTYRAQVAVNVSAAKTLSSVSIANQPSKKTYYIGDSLNTDGLKINAVYNDNTTTDVTAQCEFTGFASDSAGTKTVTAAYTFNGVKKTATFSITVKTPAITASPNPLVLNVGDKVRIGATTEPLVSGTQVQWFRATNAGNYITLSIESGSLYITGKAVGSTKLYAEFSYNEKDYSTEISITVNEKTTVDVSGISFPIGGSVNVQYRQRGEIKILPEVFPSDATNKNYTLKSSDESVATVHEDGRIETKGRGTAVITATTEDGGYTASYTINVSYSFLQWLIVILLFGWIWY